MGSGNGTALLSKSETPTSSKALSSRKRDFSKVLVWDSPDYIADYHDLCENPPLHSVVIQIAPSMAEQLLLVANTHNRQINQGNIKDLCNEMEDGCFELTGDTIKFSTIGTLLDGQHRLHMSVKTKKPLTSHVIFGLNDDIFDILDRARKRTAGDILGLCGIENPSQVAAAIRWILRFEGALEWPKKLHVTPRTTRVLASGRLKGVSEYAKHGALIAAAFKQPPSLITALAYQISRHSKALAEDFIHEWAHGARRGRNQNFDVLSSRFIKIARQSGGHVNSSLRAALIIQTFNHWNAHVVASERSLTWRKEWKFPTFVFDKDVFLHGKREAEKRDTSLSATQPRVLKAMADGADVDLCTMTHADIAKASSTPRGTIPYILTTLIEDDLIERESNGKFRIRLDKIKDGATA
jgi:hypothetical protein